MATSSVSQTTEKPEIDIMFGGELLKLLPDKAVLWPAENMLLVADTHFGKGEVFRRHGIAVPAGSSAKSMQRIDRLLTRYPATRLVVLGDFLHGKPSEALVLEVAQWSDNLPAQLTVLRGNHDRHLANKPEQWQSINMCTQEQHRKVLLQHEPEIESTDGAGAALSGHTICGHIHPVATLGRGRSDRFSMPVFWHERRDGGEQLVLPSFGSFTGGFRVQPGKSTKLYAAGDDAVMSI